jgi:hypothetical protein
MRAKSFKSLWSPYVVLVAIMMAGTWSTVYTQALAPESVELTAQPGDSIDITKTVSTPTIPQLPDICFLADTTGSMRLALADVQANATSIMNTVAGVQPDAQFCAAQYKDIGDPLVFNVDQTITDSIGNVQNAINTWTAAVGATIPSSSSTR